MTIILSVESSSDFFSVAILNNHTVLGSIFETERLKQSEKLPLLAEFLMNKCSVTFKDVEYIAANIGPGSFTGVRVGCAFALGLACFNTKTVGITTFDAIHFRSREATKGINNFFAAIDAGRGEFYFSHNDFYLLLKYEEAASYIKNILSTTGFEKIAIGGTGIFKLFDLIDPELRQHIMFLPRFQTPDARIIGKCAYNHIQQNKELNESLEPCYIRKSDAKVSVKSLFK